MDFAQYYFSNDRKYNGTDLPIAVITGCRISSAYLFSLHDSQTVQVAHGHALFPQEREERECVTTSDLDRLRIRIFNNYSTSARWI